MKNIEKKMMAEEIAAIGIKGPDDEKIIRRSLRKKSKMIARCYKAGMTKAQLARALKVTDVTILYWLRKEGIHKDAKYTIKRKENKKQDLLDNFCSHGIDKNKEEEPAF